MKKENSIQINAVLNVIKQCCMILFPLITYPYASRVLGKANLGRVSWSDSIVQYFVLFAQLGIPTYAMREGARIRNNKSKITKLASELFSISFCAMIFSYIILFLLIHFIPRMHVEELLLGILSINIIANILGRDWINSVYEDFFYITVRYIAFQIVALVLILAFVKEPSDFPKYAFFLLIANSGGYFANILYTRRYVPYKFTTHLHLKKHLKPITYLFGITLASTIYIKSDIIILGFFRSNGEVGVYTLASNIYAMIKALLNALIAVTIPRISFYLGEKNEYELNKLTYYLKLTLYSLVIPAIVGVFMLSKDIITLLGGSSFTEGYIALQILCFALFGSIFASFYSQVILVPHRLEKNFFFATVISALLNIGLNMFFIPWWGMNGAALTTLLAEGTVMVICAFYSKPFMSNIHHVHILPILIGCAGIFCICFVIQLFISKILLRIILSILLSVILYFIVLWIGKNEFALESIQIIKKKLHLK
ncbi:flippase [Absicoccus porci]|uniref:flippase n=1 Tax=Absicoccus porci TaxID=2486576 RepID=UPI0015687145|nr:flippase [Absicoccus porci]